MVVWITQFSSNQILSLFLTCNANCQVKARVQLWVNLNSIWLESLELKTLVWFQSYRSAKGPARAAGSFLVRHLSQKRRPHKSLQETNVAMDNNNSSSSDAASSSAAAASDAAAPADKRIEGRRFTPSSSWWAEHREVAGLLPELHTLSLCHGAVFHWICTRTCNDMILTHSMSPDTTHHVLHITCTITSSQHMKDWYSKMGAFSWGFMF